MSGTRESRRISTTMSVRQLMEVTTNLSIITLPLPLMPSLQITNNTIPVTLNINLILLHHTTPTLNSILILFPKTRPIRTLTIPGKLQTPFRARVAPISLTIHHIAILPRTLTLPNHQEDKLRTLLRLTTSRIQKSSSSGFQINKDGMERHLHHIFQQERDLTASTKSTLLAFLSLFLSSAGSVAPFSLTFNHVTIVSLHCLQYPFKRTLTPISLPPNYLVVPFLYLFTRSSSHPSTPAKVSRPSSRIASLSLSESFSLLEFYIYFSEFSRFCSFSRLSFPLFPRSLFCLFVERLFQYPYTSIMQYLSKLFFRNCDSSAAKLIKRPTNLASLIKLLTRSCIFGTGIKDVVCTFTNDVRAPHASTPSFLYCLASHLTISLTISHWLIPFSLKANFPRTAYTSCYSCSSAHRRRFSHSLDLVLNQPPLVFWLLESNGESTE